MVKKVTKEQKEEIISKVKSGIPVNEVAEQYGINRKSVYNWLQSRAEKSSDILELNKLRRENQALTQLVGKLVYEQELRKKNWVNK